jgi:hypothetical protein
MLTGEERKPDPIDLYLRVRRSTFAAEQSKLTKKVQDKIAEGLSLDDAFAAVQSENIAVEEGPFPGIFSGVRRAVEEIQATQEEERARR